MDPALGTPQDVGLKRKTEASVLKGSDYNHQMSVPLKRMLLFTQLAIVDSITNIT